MDEIKEKIQIPVNSIEHKHRISNTISGDFGISDEDADAIGDLSAKAVRDFMNGSEYTNSGHVIKLHVDRFKEVFDSATAEELIFFGIILGQKLGKMSLTTDFQRVMGIVAFEKLISEVVDFEIQRKRVIPPTP